MAAISDPIWEKIEVTKDTDIFATSAHSLQVLLPPWVRSGVLPPLTSAILFCLFVLFVQYQVSLNSAIPKESKDAYARWRWGSQDLTLACLLMHCCYLVSPSFSYSFISFSCLLFSCLITISLPTHMILSVSGITSPSFFLAGSAFNI